MHQTRYSKLTKEQKSLLDSAEKVMQNAYSPYSNFCVGSAVLTSNGLHFVGVNVENASYGGTVCAERSAILNANSNGNRKIVALAVIAKGKDFDCIDPTAPCGFCRQVIFEFSQISGVDIEVFFSNTKKDKIIVTKISELLPLAFGPKDLNVSVC